MKCFLLFAMIFSPIFGIGSSFERPQTAEDWEEQRAFLNENSYLWIRNFYDDDEAEATAAWATIMHNQAKIQLQEKNFTGDLIVVPEGADPSLVCRTEDDVTCFPRCGEWIESTILTFLDELTQEPHVLFKDKLNFKWPGGSAFLAHQDFPAFDPFSPKISSECHGVYRLCHFRKRVSPSGEQLVIPMQRSTRSSSFYDRRDRSWNDRERTHQNVRVTVPFDKLGRPSNFHLFYLPFFRKQQERCSSKSLFLNL